MHLSGPGVMAITQSEVDESESSELIDGTISTGVGACVRLAFLANGPPSNDGSEAELLELPLPPAGAR